MKANRLTKDPATAPALHAYSDAHALANALADRIAEAMGKVLDTSHAATLAVSGGSTPKLLFQTLSRRTLPWDRITVTLIDERFVPPADARSNHRLVATHLLQNEAAHARFLPLFAADLSPTEAARRASEEIRKLPGHLDVAVLGMGLDGHTASWFPGSPQLSACVDPDTPETVVAVNAPAAVETRLTLTLPVVAAAPLCLLHIEGNDKKRVYDEAMTPGPVADLPVRALLNKAGSPLQVYWAP